jgi:hypothetical protein
VDKCLGRIVLRWCGFQCRFALCSLVMDLVGRSLVGIGQRGGGRLKFSSVVQGLVGVLSCVGGEILVEIFALG